MRVVLAVCCCLLLGVYYLSRCNLSIYTFHSPLGVSAPPEPVVRVPRAPREERDRGGLLRTTAAGFSAAGSTQVRNPQALEAREAVRVGPGPGRRRRRALLAPPPPRPLPRGGGGLLVLLLPPHPPPPPPPQRRRPARVTTGALVRLARLAFGGGSQACRRRRHLRTWPSQLRLEHCWVALGVRGCGSPPAGASWASRGSLARRGTAAAYRRYPSVPFPSPTCLRRCSSRRGSRSCAPRSRARVGAGCRRPAGPAGPGRKRSDASEEDAMCPPPSRMTRRCAAAMGPAAPRPPPRKTPQKKTDDGIYACT